MRQNSYSAINILPPGFTYPSYVFILTLAIYIIHYINMYVYIKTAKQSAKASLNDIAKIFTPKSNQKWKNTSLNRFSIDT